MNIRGDSSGVPLLYSFASGCVGRLVWLLSKFREIPGMVICGKSISVYVVHLPITFKVGQVFGHMTSLAIQTGEIEYLQVNSTLPITLQSLHTGYSNFQVKIVL